MTTWADRIGRRQLGIGQSLQPGAVPKPVNINYTNFRFGLMLGERFGDVREGYYSFALDVETSRRDGAKRSAGIVLVENTWHKLKNWGVHTSLDSQSELIAFDPPYIGVKAGPLFSWTNIGLEDFRGLWVTSNYGDTLLFSNGRESYSRAQDGKVARVAKMPGAATILTAFGRVFVGGTTEEGGQYNSLGISWNGVDGDFSDWTGQGIGSELLLMDAQQGDWVVAARILSYDVIAILCRRSLWIGVKSGDFSHPANFEFRLSGIGCVVEPTAHTTEGGITFLSDEGVRHFDGQTATIISGPVNQDILPIDFTKLDQYRATWDSSRRRYILCTPVATYIYQFRTPEYPQGAWFKKSIILTNVVAFARQSDDPTWDTLGEMTWDELGNQTWLDLGTPESIASPDILYANGTQYGVETDGIETYFNTLMSSVFEPRPAETVLTDQPDRLIETELFLVDYAGGGTIQIFGRNEQGIYVRMVEAILPIVSAPRTVRINLTQAMRAVGIAVKILTGNIEVLRIRQVAQDNGPALNDMLTEDHVLATEAGSTYLATNNGVILSWQYGR